MSPPRSPSVPRSLAAIVVLATLAHAQAHREIRFNRDVRPILSGHCFQCHGPDAGGRKAGLRLDRRDDALAVIAPGRPEDSELMRRVTATDASKRMPKNKKGQPGLSAAQVAILRRWIEQGADYEPHWSFGALRRPRVPRAGDDAWVRNPIDRFVRARHRQARVAHGPLAKPPTLLRRVHFDLTGLPPTRADVDAFLAAPAKDRFERTVERLLASPRHAERMAMHWLDLVRYADTVGYHGDQVHNISPYRDWVLHAFRDNVPFDVFTTEQLAGDLLSDPTVEQRIATGYNRVLQTSHEGGVQAGEYLVKYAADRVRNLSSVWLGATVGCAECHDHKFDPFTQRDFYSLAAFFADVQEKGDFKGSGNTNPTQRPPEIDVITRLDREFATGPTQPAKRRTMVTVAVTPRTTRVLPRGDWLDNSGAIVTPATPTFLPRLDVRGRRPTRLDLARWLTSSENPLTARVFVNRLWQMFFGRGLSKVLDDVGSRGAWPSHPALLDWLAREFVDSSWDVRHMIRLIVTSATYRQASTVTRRQRERDPDNVWLARQARFRLPAEMVRDNALAISGLLVHQLGGPSVKPYQPAGYYAHLNFPRRRYVRHKGASLYRRSLYMHWQRQFLHPMLKAFDAPTREECTAERPISNTPAAALALLNDPAFIEAARVFAARTMRDGGATDTARLRWCWRQALTRRPNANELSALRRLLERHRAEYRGDRAAARHIVRVGESPVPTGLDVVEFAAWTSVARVLLNLNETITRN